MASFGRSRRARTVFLLAILALALGVGAPGSASAAGASAFPRIPVWAYPGVYQDSSIYRPNRCVGSFKAPLADSIRERSRAITVRFLRDRRAEARRDFGGYRIYRATSNPDTSQMMLIRRFSRNAGDERTWNFSVVDTATLQFKCLGQVVHDSVVTFIDPDSNGAWVKVCRRVDIVGRCLTVGDSIFKLIPPPGPHDGFLTWYAVTYEARNTTDNLYEDLYVAGRDTFDTYARCATPGDSSTCPMINLNHKALNVSNGTAAKPFADPIEPTAGPTATLQQVAVVPNPYRAHEAWDQAGGHEVHFINLPSRARIRIYTVSGDLVADLDHDENLPGRQRDFARWDLKNANGRDVASGIYMYRIEASGFSFQNRFIVIR